MFYHDRWPVFYEDNHLLVLYKPAGLIMQRDHKNKANLLDLAKQWIKVRYAKPGKVFAGMVHRLDGPVAGIVVVARTSKAASRLSAQIRHGRITKQYLAVVQGRPPKPSDRVENDMVRAGRLSRIATRESARAQKAVLHYDSLDTLGNCTLLAIDLGTGRRHQIRLQLSHLGCPVLGDVNYGASSAMPHGRIALFSHRISFEHPTRYIRMQFETPVPLEWPWPSEEDDADRPLWTIEAYEQAGLVLPEISASR